MVCQGHFNTSTHVREQPAAVSAPAGQKQRVLLQIISNNYTSLMLFHVFRYLVVIPYRVTLLSASVKGAIEEKRVLRFRLILNI